MKDKKNLRTGYTTGSCATASAKAAVIALLTQKPLPEITINLPVGQTATFQLHSCTFSEIEAQCSVIKDAGDDPDVTHGAEIIATVRKNGTGKLVLAGGEGVGKVTKPGIGVPIGDCAINPVPRKMIRESVAEAIASIQRSGNQELGLDVTISVPNGKEIAKKTLNERLGIIGGISILGTRGIVSPYSTKAYKHCIVAGINVARAEGHETLVFTTGGRTEKWSMKILGLPESSYIQMADFVGYALQEGVQGGAKKLIIAAMPGKLAKIASGHLQTHAKKSSLDMNIMATFAKEAGIEKKSLLKEIREANTARHIFEILSEEENRRFFGKLCEKSANIAFADIKGAAAIETILMDFEGKEVARYEQKA